MDAPRPYPAARLASEPAPLDLAALDARRRRAECDARRACAQGQSRAERAIDELEID